MQNEPAVIAGAIGAILALLIAFGVPITADQKVAILGAVIPVYSLVASLFVRANVTPASKS